MAVVQFMKLLFPMLLSLSLLVPLIQAFTFYNCVPDIYYPVTVQQVTVKPDPVVSLTEATFFINATTGYATVKPDMKLHIETIEPVKADPVAGVGPNLMYDTTVCENTKPSTCPVHPETKFQIEVAPKPHLYKKGTTTVKMIITDQSNYQYMCIRIDFEVV